MSTHDTRNALGHASPAATERKYARVPAGRSTPCPKCHAPLRDCSRGDPDMHCDNCISVWPLAQLNARVLSTAAPRTYRTPTGLTDLAGWLAYCHSCAQAWIAEGRKEDAEELLKVGYELLREIEADGE